MHVLRLKSSYNLNEYFNNTDYVYETLRRTLYAVRRIVWEEQTFVCPVRAFDSTTRINYIGFCDQFWDWHN